MSKFAYQRLDDLLDFLLLKKDPVLIKDIASTLNVSERTIRNDILNLNDYLLGEKAKVKLIRQRGYLLQTDNKKSFIDWWENFNNAKGYTLLGSLEERQNYLLVLLLNEQTFYSTSDLMDLLFVSKNTLYGYLKNIRAILANYNLTLVNRTNTGFRLVGSEFNKRQAILDLFLINDLQSYLLGFTNIEQLFFANINLEQLTQLELSYLSPLNLLDSDFYHKNILSTLALAISRIKNGLMVVDIPHNIPSLTEETLVIVHSFIKEIEQCFTINFTPNEVNYFILSLSINVPRLIKNIKHFSAISAAIVSELLASIHQKTNFNWTKDDILFNDLVSHIEGFIKMNLIDPGRKNPILNTIKNSFPLAYDLSLTHLELISKKYDLYFSEDEVGYIALHIAGAIERNKKNNKILNVIIVCGSGGAMSRIIEAKIIKKYQSQFNIIKKYSYAEFQRISLTGVDLTITTLPFLDKNTPTAFIDMDNLDKEIDNLGYYLEKSSTRFTNTFQLFNPKNFYYYAENNFAKDKLLAIMVADLEAQSIVPNGFLPSVLAREKLHATTINNIIAIPHPMDMSAVESRVSVAIFPKGIAWDENEKSHFIFLFAIAKEDNKNTETIYDLLLELIDNEAIQKQLLQAETFENFKEILSHL